MCECVGEVFVDDAEKDIGLIDRINGCTSAWSFSLIHSPIVLYMVVHWHSHTTHFNSWKDDDPYCRDTQLFLSLTLFLSCQIPSRTLNLSPPTKKKKWFRKNQSTCTKWMKKKKYIKFFLKYREMEAGWGFWLYLFIYLTFINS